MVAKSTLLIACLLIALVPSLVLHILDTSSKSGISRCPYHPATDAVTAANTFSLEKFAAVDFDVVKADIEAALTNSQPSWPADYGHYGPLMIRLAWHCAGTYRTSDGRGGCDGGRQRFDPERSWADNTNLDKARALLRPIKLKHGAGLSWGDLIVLAGNVAIESMGGPVLGFCAGRIDDADGSASAELGPSSEQEAIGPCPVNGQCTAPLGATTVGLIYVNPEGPMGQPLPKLSVLDVRDTFGRMGMDDEETVSLIGGGHAFGKTHGACPTGPGPAPKDSPSDPWPGTCGKGADKGKGPNTFTAGFEGPWTRNPTTWDNEYFQNLVEFDWENHTGPGGHQQWRPVPKAAGGAARRGAAEPLPEVMMLTSDVSLINDPKYLKLVKLYARNISKLNHAFAHSWYKMTTRDMGPVTRCLGKNVPPPQPFQFPLPDPPAKLPDFEAVRAQIKRTIYWRRSSVLQPDFVGGAGSKPTYAAVFALLAWQCASTFRATDHRGGCNGARLRFAPEKDWPLNFELDKALHVLQPVKDQFGDSLSYADLIVLAGQTAIEEAGGYKTKFCGGRVDALNGAGSANLEPRNYSDVVLGVRDTIKVMGLTPREYVALRANLRSAQHQKRLGYSGSWTADPSVLTNEFFKVLLSEEWQQQAAPNGRPEYKSVTADGDAGGTTVPLYMLPEDLSLRYDAQLLAVAEEYASDQRAFLNAFADAWTKVMNADRFNGPAGSVCA